MPNQGGTHEQHVKAGQQSHKNDDSKNRQQAQGGQGNEGQQRGGKANPAEDRNRASQAGHKGEKH